MTAIKAQSNNIKHQLRLQHQLTLKAFAEKYGYSYRNVSDCVRGHCAGNYGAGRDILEKLQALTGLKLLSKDSQMH